jgi:hypothetical protein
VAAFSFSDGVDRDDVGVVQFGGSTRLALEALDGDVGEAETGW